MSANIIDGKAYAAGLRDRIQTAVTTLPDTPCLAVVLVGDDPASRVYVCLLYTSPSPRDQRGSRMPSSA